MSAGKVVALAPAPVAPRISDGTRAAILDIVAADMPLVIVARCPDGHWRTITHLPRQARHLVAYEAVGALTHEIQRLLGDIETDIETLEADTSTPAVVAHDIDIETDPAKEEEE